MTFHSSSWKQEQRTPISFHCISSPVYLEQKFLSNAASTGILQAKQKSRASSKYTETNQAVEGMLVFSLILRNHRDWVHM